MKHTICLVLHNIRSTHNVGSIFRTAEGFGVTEIILSGYTPYPLLLDDSRLPHIAAKLDAQIHKTALGAEKLVPFRFIPTLEEVLDYLNSKHLTLLALEQAKNSVNLKDYRLQSESALFLGEEVEGIEQNILQQCNTILEIPMSGQKESFNVSVAAGIALYHLHTMS